MLTLRLTRFTIGGFVTRPQYHRDVAKPIFERRTFRSSILSAIASTSDGELKRLAHLHTSNTRPKEIEKWRSEHQISVTGTVECPDPILNFEDTPFSEGIISSLTKLYSSPLPIQSQGWSVALSGKNMVGCAETGSGKTVAFLLPAFEHIKLQSADKRKQGPSALVLAPTRELALQIESESQKFNRAYNVNVACLYGGAGNRRNQLRSLTYNPGLIIATPGRLLDLVECGGTALSNVNFLVLDEADRMLEMGFEESLRSILNLVKKDPQVCMWTATWPKKLNALARDYFNDYVKVTVGSEDLSANPKVKQIVEVVEPFEKFDRLLQILEENPEGKFLIFSERKADCDHLGWRLSSSIKSKIAALHGDKNQMQRESILHDFKSGSLRILLATDVAARGIDVKDIDFVVNFDFPQNIESYIHRIGRTARAGKTGTSVSFFTKLDIAVVGDLVNVLEGANQPVPDSIRRIWEANSSRSSSNSSRFSKSGKSGKSKSSDYGDAWSSSGTKEPSRGAGRGYGREMERGGKSGGSSPFSQFGGGSFGGSGDKSVRNPGVDLLDIFDKSNNRNNDKSFRPTKRRIFDEDDYDL